MYTYRDSDNNIRYNVLPAITVCNDHIFEELLFNNKTRPALSKAILMKDYDKFNKSLFNLKSNNTFSNDLIRFLLNSIKLYYEESIESLLSSYQTLIDFLDVNDRQEFNEVLQKYNNKSAFGLNNTKLEISLYKNDFECGFDKRNVLLNETILTDGTGNDAIYCNFLFPVSKILSPFGKCFTYFYKLDENQFKTYLYLSSELLSINDKSYKGYEKNRLKMLNRRILFHSTDSLPVLTTEENFFTDFTVTKRAGFLAKLEKFEFQRLPKPYDTNCQKYGNSTRFQCLNECYFDGYMSSDIKCIPNSESLYSIVLNDYSKDSEHTFCPYVDPYFIKKLNSYLTERCNQICLDSCEDMYYSTQYDETIGSFLLGHFSIRLQLKSFYFKRFKYFAKMTFISLILNMANIFSLWHGVTVLGLLKKVIKAFNQNIPFFFNSTHVHAHCGILKKINFRVRV